MKDGLPVVDAADVQMVADPFAFQADLEPHIAAALGKLQLQVVSLQAQLMAQGEKFRHEVALRDARIAELQDSEKVAE